MGAAPPMSAGVRLGVSSAALLFSLGCSKGPSVRFSDPSALLDRIYERTSCSRAVQGEGRLEVAGPIVRQRGKVMFKAEAPAQLRFDLYSDLGVTLATLVTQGDKLSFFDLSTNTFVTGGASACNLAQFTRVQVSPLALVELLRGRAPVLRHAPAQARLKWQDSWFGLGRYELSFSGESTTKERVWITVPEQDWARPLHEQRTFVSRVQVWQHGRTLYAVDLQDYRVAHRASLVPTADELEMGIVELEATGPLCDAELPHQLTFDVGSGGHELRLVVQDAFHNPPRVPGAYELNVPNGARASSATCP